MSSALRAPAIVVAVYLACWLLLDLAAENIRGSLDVSIWYPPAGLSVALLLVFGARYAPAVALAMLLHLLLFRDGASYPPTLLFGIPVAYAAVYAGTVVVLTRGMRADPRLARARDVLLFVGVACLAAPLLANAAAVAGYALADYLPWGSLPANVLGSWAGEATGVGVLAPILLLWLRRYPGLWAIGGREDGFDLKGYELSARRELPELLGQAVVLALAIFVAFGGGRGMELDYAYLPFVPLVWVAVRQGFARTTLVVFLVNAGAVALVGTAAVGSNPILLQFGLTTLTLVGLIVGALVSERRSTAELLMREASRDRLTGLPNRAAFFDLLDRRGRQGGGFAVLVADLNGLGAVNGALGHEAGDGVLVEVAQRAAALAGEEGRAARVDGDRFAVLAEGAGTAREADRRAAELAEEFARPYEVHGRKVSLTAGVGASLGGVEGEAPRDPEELLREADTALEKAKAGGSSRRVVFDRDLAEEVSSRMETEAGLHAALEGGQFELLYQPVFTACGRDLVGTEALLRWRRPGRGIVGPAEFMGLAEQTGLIGPLGEWVLRQALRDARAWDGTPNPPWVAVNVSVRQAQRPGFAEEVMRMLEESGFPPGRLRLELTESALAEETVEVRRSLGRLAGTGVAIAVDDFGTGYSPLSNLKELPVSVVKIDRSFVAGLPDEPDDATIVGAIVAMAEGMGIEVVAEGVENEAQLAFLQEIGCGAAQGFLLGRPMPVGDIAGLAGARSLGEEG